ncbi:LamG-like jellyroll fold domain-containing protein [Streptosporangium fragile]|uniref:LamG-like jellyroll fold domain-containing protein n=1 Tax=Streptosporangium fragile TaxID=46186 RepID=UPI0031E85AEA
MTNATVPAATVWCEDYPYWSSTQKYSFGDVVYYNAYLWEVTGFSTTVGTPPDWDRAWTRRAACSYHKSPWATPVAPAHGALVASRTPALLARGGSNDAYTVPVTFTFKICDNAAMTTGCTSSGALAKSLGDATAWTVPAGKLTWSKQYWWTVTITDTGSNLTTTSEAMTFTTGVHQPVIGSQLAARGVNGQEFHQSPGNYTTEATDLVVATAGPPLAVNRSYNSMDARTDGIFGAGWSTRWDMKLVREVRGEMVSALVTYPDGRRVRFAANGDGSYQPPPGMYATLAEVTGGGWRLMDKSSTSYVFDAQGRLTTVTDGRGRAQTLVYGTGGKLEKVTAAGGRSLTFTWTGAHVASVSSDPVDGSPVTWTYHYEGDKLTAVCAPVAAPNCTHYAYGSGSQYRGIVQDSEPYGYWRLGDSSGSAAKDLGSGAGAAFYEGRSSGGAPSEVLYGKPGALAGTPDTAVELKNAVVRLPDYALSNLGDQVSVELWFKTTGSGVLMAAGERNDFLLNQPMLYIGTDGKLRGSFHAAAAPMASAGAVNDNAWHHVALTITGDAQALYLDGAQIGTMTGKITTWRPYTEVGHGIVTPGSAPGLPTGTGTQEFPFHGLVDEVAVYGKPLTAAEVAAHHAARAEAPAKLTKITLPSGRVWADNTYDPGTDRIATHVDQHGGTWKLSDLVYAPATGTSTVTVTDPNNNTLTYVHDAWRGNRLISRTDQLSKVTTYAYDTGGFPVKVTDPNNNVTEQVNDARGNVTAIKTCRTATSCQTSYQAFYRNTADEFDPRNDQVTVVRDARSASATDTTYATVTEYTTHGDVAKITTPATPDFPSGRSTTYTYTDGTEAAVGGGTTPAGLVKSAKDLRGNETTYRYTAAGDVAEQTSPSGLKTTFTHDGLGRVASSTQVSEAHPDGVTTTFTYDGLGRMLTQTGPGVKNEVTNVTHTAKVTFTYDPDGNKLTEALSDLTGGDVERKTVYTYDDHGRVETVTDPENGVTRSTWNATGALASTTDPMGTVLTYAYTKRGEPYTTTLKNWTGSPVNPQAPQDVVLESHAYDSGGRLASKTDAMGRTTSYTYFANNRLSQVTAKGARLNGLTTPADVVLQDNTYDAAGNVTKQVTGGSKQVTVERVYDAAGRLTSTTFDPAALKRTTAFEYDAAGNITKKTFTGGSGTRTESTVYAYNVLGLVTRQTVENGDDDLVTTSTYDDRGLVTAVTDPRGNAAGATAADFTTTMRYDGAGRLVETKAPQVTIEKNGSAADGRPTVKYGYDTAGLRTHEVDAEGRTVTSTFDKAGRPASTTLPSYTPPGAPTAPTGQQARWKFDETAGTSAADASGHNHTLTLAGTTAWQSGKTGNGLHLANGDGYAQSAGPVLDTSASYTVAGWVKLDDLTTWQSAASQTGTTSSAFALTYDPDVKKWIWSLTGADASNPASEHVEADTVAQTGTWTHLAGVYDHAAQKIRLYVNGVLNDEAPFTAPWKATGPFVVGRTLNDGDHVDYLRGSVDDLHAYPRALSDEEISAQYGSATSAPCPTTCPTGAVTPKVSFAYDAAGRQTKVTDPRNHVTTTEYDALGRPVRVTEPGPSGPGGQWVSEYNLIGEQLAVVDLTGARTEATYDDLDRKITTTQVERKPTTAAYTTKLEYDTAGNLIKSIDPRSKVTSYAVNAAGEVTGTTDPNNNTSAVEYDLLGRQTKVTDPLKNATEVTYDLAGRKIATKDLTGTGAVVRTFGFGYDPAGNPTSTTSGEGHVTQRTFDALGRLTSLIEPVSADKTITTTFGYDATGARTRLTDGRGHATWTTYNTLGLVESVIEPSTTAHPNAADRTWTSVYDAAGNAVATLQPGGVRIDRVFDPLNRVTKETGTGTSVATPERTVTYDDAGRVTAIGDYTLDYNDRSLLTKVSKATTQVATYAWDGAGNLTQRVDPTGTATYAWDNASRLQTATDPVTGRTWTYGYDNADRLTSKTSANPAGTQSYGYDAVDRLTSHTVKNSSGTELAKITYGWDKDDNLTTKTTTGTAGAGANTYGYDRSGRLTSWTAPGGAITAYEWDDAGNRTKAGDKTFTYDERNRLLSGGGTDYTYTPRGTVATETTGGVTKNLTFDAFDRLITDGEATYGYDALGRMTSRTKGTVQQRFVYSGLTNDIAAVTDGAGAIQARYGRDPSGGLLSLQEGTGPALATMTDLHGDLVGTFSGTALVDSTAYDPFGQVIQRSGTARALGYQGEYTDPDTGKVNMDARWYQPGTGAFASRDTATLTPDPSVQANRYTYANASPLTHADPSGHNSIVINNPVPRPAPKGDPTVTPYYSWGGLSDLVYNGSDSDEDDYWWSRNYSWYATMPQLGDDEIERLGYKYMPNGREVDQPNFWDGKTREDEITRQEYMLRWRPWLKEEQLSSIWVRVGGLNSLESKNVTVAAGGIAYYKSSVGKVKFKNYEYFKGILEYYNIIKAAADGHGIDKNVLAAVIMWEIRAKEVKYGGIGALAAIYYDYRDEKRKGMGWGASIGIAQLELYKARMMLEKYYGKAKWGPGRARLGDVAEEMLDPHRAIHLAAAWMEHLKQNVWYMKDGAKHYLDDKEAAIAYCGCSGVTVVAPGTGNTSINFARFRVWAENGWRDEELKVGNPDPGIKRRRDLERLWAPGGAVDEYWQCNRIGWLNCY